MEFFEIISLMVHWDSTVGHPFLNTSFPITKDDCLCDVIKQEVLRKDAIQEGGRPGVHNRCYMKLNLAYECLVLQTTLVPQN